MIRGSRAKTNFSMSDYFDTEGNLMADVQVQEKLEAAVSGVVIKRPIPDASRSSGAHQTPAPAGQRTAPASAAPLQGTSTAAAGTTQPTKTARSGSSPCAPAASGTPQNHSSRQGVAATASPQCPPPPTTAATARAPAPKPAGLPPRFPPQLLALALLAQRKAQAAQHAQKSGGTPPQQAQPQSQSQSQAKPQNPPQPRQPASTAGEQQQGQHSQQQQQEQQQQLPAQEQQQPKAVCKHEQDPLPDGAGKGTAQDTHLVVPSPAPTPWDAPRTSAFETGQRQGLKRKVPPPSQLWSWMDALASALPQAATLECLVPCKKPGVRVMGVLFSMQNRDLARPATGPAAAHLLSLGSISGQSCNNNNSDSSCAKGPPPASNDPPGASAGDGDNNDRDGVASPDAASCWAAVWCEQGLVMPQAFPTFEAARAQCEGLMGVAALSLLDGSAHPSAPTLDALDPSPPPVAMTSAGMDTCTRTISAQTKTTLVPPGHAGGSGRGGGSLMSGDAGAAGADDGDDDGVEQPPKRRRSHQNILHPVQPHREGAHPVSDTLPTHAPAHAHPAPCQHPNSQPSRPTPPHHPPTKPTPAMKARQGAGGGMGARQGATSSQDKSECAPLPELPSQPPDARASAPTQQLPHAPLAQLPQPSSQADIQQQPEQGGQLSMHQLQGLNGGTQGDEEGRHTAFPDPCNLTYTPLEFHASMGMAVSGQLLIVPGTASVHVCRHLHVAHVHVGPIM